MCIRDSPLCYITNQSKVKLDGFCIINVCRKHAQVITEQVCAFTAADWAPLQLSDAHLNPVHQFLLIFSIVIGRISVATCSLIQFHLHFTCNPYYIKSEIFAWICMSLQSQFNPLKGRNANWLHLAIQVWPTFLISDIRALWRSSLSVRMSEIKNVG